MIMTSQIATSHYKQLGSVHFYSHKPPSHGNSIFHDALSQELLLSSFDVETGQRHPLVHWSTFLEIDCLIFTLERSADLINWDAIYQTESGENYSMGQCLYSWMDDKPCTSISYYRLKIVDPNGDIEYSPIKAFNFNDIADVSQMLAYPNPFINTLTIEDSMNDLLKINILDASGLDVSPSVNIVVTHSNLLNVDVSALPSGTYYIQTPTDIVKATKL